MSANTPNEVDFDIISEGWTKYKLKTDKALLRVRIVASKIFEVGSGDTGVPNFAIGGQNYLSVLVPRNDQTIRSSP